MSSLRRRQGTPWRRHLAVVGAIIVIIGAVLLGVAKSTPVNVTPAGNSTFAALNVTTTYAAHCQAGQPFQVRQGDTLSKIAARLGVSVTDLAKTNGLKVNDSLIPGQVLCPPVKNAVAPVIVSVGTGSLELCQSTDYWLPVISQWAIPPGCYGLIYSPNPANYPYRPAWGWCNWWPEEMHPNLTGEQALQLPRHRTPVAGAVVWLDPYEQGASGDGHWAQLVAINPDGYWLLISEMNDNWRGGGWGRVNYRYIHISPGVWFLY
jgi:LysM repeat protein